MYRIIILPKALRSLESFDKPTAARIIDNRSITVHLIGHRKDIYKLT